MIDITLREHMIVVAAPESDVAIARTIPGARWFPAAGVWTYPLSSLAKIRAAYNGTANYSPELLAMIEADTARTERALSKYIDGQLPDGRTLRKHQREGIVRMVEKKKIILADEPGLGKTITSLIAAKYWKQERGCRVIVLALATLHEQWYREARKMGVMLEVVYSWAVRAVEAPDGPYVLIADEAHLAQNISAKRTKIFLQLAERAEAVYALTGTPMKNGQPKNLFPLLVSIGHPLGESRGAYERKFCDAKKTRFSRWDTSGAANLKELHMATRDVILRRTKKECLDLPPRQSIIVPAEVSPEDEAVYHAEVKAAIDKYIAEGREEMASQVKRAVGLCWAQRHAAARAKMGATVAAMRDLAESGRRSVCFATNVDVIEGIAAALGCDAVTGQVKESVRQEMIDRFARGESDFLCLTDGVGGTGVDKLQMAASDLFLVNRGWTPGDVDQCESRLEREGQTSRVMSFWMQWGVADKKYDPLLDEKADRIDMVLGGEFGDSPRAFNVESMQVALAQLIVESER